MEKRTVGQKSKAETVGRWVGVRALMGRWRWRSTREETWPWVRACSWVACRVNTADTETWTAAPAQEGQGRLHPYAQTR